MEELYKALVGLSLICLSIVTIFHTRDLSALRARVNELENKTNVVERITIYGQNN